MPNRTCPSCSQPVFADDSFCTHCGVRLSDGSLPEEQPGAPSPAQAESATIRQEIGQLKRELQEAGQLLNRLQESLVAIQRAQFEQPGQPTPPAPTSSPAAQPPQPLLPQTPEETRRPLSRGIIPPAHHPGQGPPPPQVPGLLLLLLLHSAVSPSTG